VVEEIKQIHRNYPYVDYITIYDDLFAIDSKRVAAIQQRLSRENLLKKIGYAVNTRADFITDELAEVFRAMNIKVVALGTESGCQSTLDYLKSGSLKVEDNIRAIRILKKHHIVPYCSFIIGSPYEDRESMLKTIQFIKDNKIWNFDLWCLTPFPGTPVWDYAKGRGLVSDDMDWSKLDFYINPGPIIVSEKMSPSEIIEICDQAAKLRGRYLKRGQLLWAVNHPVFSFRLVLDRIWRGK
jgi:radical SAM superfamily enzyme YgiQ (UPF0313 family)